MQYRDCSDGVNEDTEVSVGLIPSAEAGEVRKSTTQHHATPVLRRWLLGAALLCLLSFCVMLKRYSSMSDSRITAPERHSFYAADEGKIVKVGFETTESVVNATMGSVQDGGMSCPTGYRVVSSTDPSVDDWDLASAGDLPLEEALHDYRADVAWVDDNPDSLDKLTSTHSPLGAGKPSLALRGLGLKSLEEASTADSHRPKYYTAFEGTEGFFVMDLGSSQVVERLRVRGDLDAADVKDITLWQQSSEPPEDGSCNTVGNSRC